MMYIKNMQLAEINYPIQVLSIDISFCTVAIVDNKNKQTNKNPAVYMPLTME